MTISLYRPWENGTPFRKFNPSKELVGVQWLEYEAFMHNKFTISVAWCKTKSSPINHWDVQDIETLCVHYLNYNPAYPIITEILACSEKLLRKYVEESRYAQYKICFS